jgi:hypothetical protein
MNGAIRKPAFTRPWRMRFLDAPVIRSFHPPVSNAADIHGKAGGTVCEQQQRVTRHCLMVGNERVTMTIVCSRIIITGKRFGLSSGKPTDQS